MNTKTAIEKAIELCNGQAQLAEAVGIKQPSVSYWLKVGKVSAEHVLNVERATNGKVTRHDLRPDIFGASPERAA